MKRILIALAIVLLAGLALKLQSGLSITTQQKFFNASLEAAIKSQKNNGNLADLTNFRWDDVCIFPPYGGLDDEHIGYNVIGEVPDSQDESRWFLLFRDKLSRQAYAIQPIVWYTKIDFSCLENKNVKFELTPPPATRPQERTQMALTVDESVDE
ncbi:MAG: hypothetical protein FJX23_04345 [Alphaproteobacteria bacterium]|nr:hypothetical protein [Alphaproteobacteria bacterium]